MSLGYGGKAMIFCEDDTQMVFSYGAYNLNIEDCKNLKFDGFITIDKKCFDVLDNGIFYSISREKN